MAERSCSSNILLYSIVQRMLMLLVLLILDSQVQWGSYPSLGQLEGAQPPNFKRAGAQG